MGESNEIPFDSPVRIALSGEDLGDPPFNLDGLSEEAVLKRLLLQIEFYFSNGNLWNDEIMRNVHGLYPDRWVPILFFASLKRIQEITSEVSLIVQALKQSTDLELDHSFTTVRRRIPVPPFNPKRDAKRCVYADTLPVGSTTRSLKKLFSRFGKVVRITPCLSLACNQDVSASGPSPLLPGIQAKPDEVLDAILVEFADKYAAKQATVSIASHNCTYRDWKHRGLSSNANTPSTCRKQLRTPQSTRLSHVEASPLLLAPSSLPTTALNGSRFSLTDFRLTPTVDLAPSNSDEIPRVLRSRLSAASPEFLPKVDPPEMARTKPLSEIVKSFAPFTPSPKEPDVAFEQVEKLDDAFNGIFVLSKYAYLSRLERLGEFILPETPVPTFMTPMQTPGSGPIMNELTALGMVRERSQPETQAERHLPSRSFTAKSPHIKSMSPHIKSMSSPHLKSMSPFFKPMPTPSTLTSGVHAPPAAGIHVPTASMPSPIMVPTRTVTLVPPLAVLPSPQVSPSISSPISEESDSSPTKQGDPLMKQSESPMKPGESPTKQSDSPTKQNDSPAKPGGLVEKKTPKITAGLPPRSNSTNWRSPHLVAVPSGSLVAQGSPSPSKGLANPPRASPTGPRGINPSPILKATESPRLGPENSNKEPRNPTKPPKVGRRPREGSFEFSLIGSSQATSLADNTNVTVHLPSSPSLSAMALMKSITPVTQANAEPPKQKTPVLRPRKSSQVEISTEGGERRASEQIMEPPRRLSVQKRSSVLGPTVSRYAVGPLEETAGFMGRGRGKPVH
jgi:hypothetical protein